MHSQEYLNARKEFVNCLLLTPICLGVSTALAFKEWKPIMTAELRKEAQKLSH